VLQLREQSVQVKPALKEDLHTAGVSEDPVANGQILVPDAVVKIVAYEGNDQHQLRSNSLGEQIVEDSSIVDHPVAGHSGVDVPVATLRIGC
jgi:hypothetical protein